MTILASKGVRNNLKFNNNVNKLNKNIYFFKLNNKTIDAVKNI